MFASLIAIGSLLVKLILGVLALAGALGYQIRNRHVAYGLVKSMYTGIRDALALQRERAGLVLKQFANPDQRALEAVIGPMYQRQESRLDDAFKAGIRLIGFLIAPYLFAGVFTFIMWQI